MLRLELMQLLTGAGVETQVRRIPSWIEQQFHFRPRCRDRIFASLTELQCLVGIRALTSALISGSIPRPDEAIQLEVGEHWQAIATLERFAKIQFPYTASEMEISRFIKREISSAAYAQRLRMVHHIEDLRQIVERKAGKEIEIDNALNNLEAAAGLQALDLYLNARGSPLDGPSEIISISNGFRLPFELGLKLQEDINAKGSLADFRNFFARPERNGFGREEAWPNTFFREREKLENTMHEIGMKHSIESIACSPAAALSQTACRLGLERLSKVLSWPVLHLPKIDRLGIVSGDEMEASADFFKDPKTNSMILLVRSDFAIGPLMRYFKYLGWESH